MIEFKAECGHTVRAKDEDAGGVVRCSYCGQPADVPENKDNEDLSFLFREVEQLQETAGTAGRRKRSRLARFFSRRRRAPDEFNPFALIAKLCWAALLFSVVFFVGNRWVVPLFKQGSRSTATVRRGEGQSSGADQPRPSRRAHRRGHGLIAGDLPTGLYVSSTPPGANVYYIEASKAPSTGRVYRTRGCSELRAAEALPRLNDGVYVVEVVFPWNDPKLTGYRNYTAFRRAIEYASDTERRKLVTEYFIPDEASAVFIEETDEQIYIVRQYRNVEVRNGLPGGVRALFLPRLPNADGATISVKQLVTHYIPNNKAYSFDEKHVRGELAYYGVPESDQDFVMEALSRIGVIPYVTPDLQTRLFKIGIKDGVFAMKVIHEANQ